MRDRGSMPPAERVVKARALFGPDSEEHKNALSAENAHIEENLARFPSAGPGHAMRSAVQTRYANGTSAPFATMHRHEVPDPGGNSSNGSSANLLTVGRVQERYDQPGVFRAEHVTYKSRGRISRGEYHDLGTFNSRLDAHKAIATAQTTHRNREIDIAARKAAANSKKAASLSGLPGPGGKPWEPYTVTGDGTRFGNAAAAKAQQAFRSGNHKVVIESAMTKEQTKGLLADITSVVDRTGLHQHEIGFHVPSGDGHFRATRNGITGAYVIQGGKTIFINPRVANNALAEQFQASGESGHFMDAAKSVPARHYTLAHELGHVVDNLHGHTSSPGARTSSGAQLPPVAQESASALAREHRDSLSRYGRKNNAEAYAEAYAQWVYGGPGSSPVADAYARRFGWTPPTG